MKTLLLDRTLWDLIIDSSGSIAMASNPYAIAQNVACAVKVFQGEAWFDTSLGVPYIPDILGGFIPSDFVALANVEAMKVPEVSAVNTVISAFDGKVVTGQIQVIDVTGAINNVHF